MKRRCASRNQPTRGSTTSNAAAISGPYSSPAASLRKYRMPSVGGMSASDETAIDGQNRPFQRLTIERIENAATDGIAIGSMIRQTIASSDRPSSRAAWINSFGMDLNTCRNRKIANGDTIHGKISAL